MGIGEAGRHPVGCGAARPGERPRDNTKTEGGISMAKKTAKGGKKKATKKR
jgi:hypothetical protein